MSFQIHSLDASEFTDLFDLSDEDLAQHRAKRVTADDDTGFPCRVSLEDAQKGDDLILVNHTHMDKSSPYMASHAVYVRKGVASAHPEPGEIPDMLAHRTLSIRGFDANGFIRHADVKDGRELGKTLEAFFRNPEIDFTDIHFAGPGCFAARATRA